MAAPEMSGAAKFYTINLVRKMSTTIAAIATALSPSGIGIIRISGDEAVTIADRIFRKPNGEKLKDALTHTVHYGHIVEDTGRETEHDIDEVMVVLMRAPHSFTREDTVEIDCHGGIYVVKRILDLCFTAGAVPATPGEFTKRAFLNGRIDLSKAEAVMDLISSSNEKARINSMNQLNGRLYDVILSLRQKLIYEIAYIESAIDDPEHYDTEDFKTRLLSVCAECEEKLNKLIASFDNGKIIQHGIQTTIVGKPNVGKSSFLNLLLGEERAIVTQVAGTTRDTLEETVSLDGVTLRLIDTAGIHETSDEVEMIGVKKAKDSIEKADLVIFLLDSSDALNEDDKNMVTLLFGKKVIALLNKTDKEENITDEEKVKALFSSFDEEVKILPFSAKTATGLTELTEYIKELFFKGELKSDEEICLTSLRHKNLAVDAANALKQVEASLKNDMPEDFYSIDLMQAYASLGAIIGEEVDDDLVDEIFSKFCMGK